MKLRLTRDLTVEECHWFVFVPDAKDGLKAGMEVYKFTYHTYGAISDGIAVTLNEDGDYPFFEIPRDSYEIV